MYKDFRNEKPEPKRTIMDELSFSNMVSIEALINILIKKGFINKEEIVEETRKVKQKWEMLNK